jgi:hypothetical protein
MKWGQAISARPGVALFIAAAVVYNLNLLPIPSGDTTPAALLPFSVLLHHSINFDPYAPWLSQAYGEAPYFLHQHGGHYYSTYPIVQPLLLTPFYAPLLLVGDLREWPVQSVILLARVLEKITASLIAALCVAAFFTLLRRLIDVRQAVVLTLVLAFATSTWSIASQALWQHGASELMIAVSLLCLQKTFEGEISRTALVGAGACGALSVAMRPTDVLFFGISCAALLVFWAGWKPLASYVISGAMVGSFLAAYNLTIFGSARGAYTQPLEGNLWSGLSGLLFSPSHGLFVYSPIFLFVFPAVYLWLRRRPSRGRELYVISLTFSIAHILLYAKWPTWWAGSCYGTRFITDAFPCLVLLLIPLAPVLDRNRALTVAFAALFAVSVYVQFLGAFNYPESHWETPEQSVERHPERLWDWADNPIRRSIAAGMDRNGYAFAYELIASRVTGRPIEIKLHVQ